MPLFDLTPKDTGRALYGRAAELEALVRLIENGRWAALLGPRMVGKTSLSKAATAQVRRPTVYVNLWGARGTQGLLNALLHGINSSRPLVNRLRGALRRVEGVTVGGAGLTLSPRPRPLRTVADLVNLLGQEAGRSVVILDEVQELANVSGALLKMLANVFNTHPKVVFVFTGSYFGLLRTLLDPPDDSPLVGRAPARIELGPFDKETSVGFLEHGFREYGVRVDRESIARVVNRSLDGIPGWLTLYGNNVAVQKMSGDAAERATVREGKTVARSELAHFLEPREPEAYWAALRQMTSPSSWTEVRDAIRARRGAFVNDNSAAKVVQALRGANLIEEAYHRYGIRDPMVRAFVRETAHPPS